MQKWEEVGGGGREGIVILTLLGWEEVEGWGGRSSGTGEVMGSVWREGDRRGIHVIVTVEYCCIYVYGM